MDHASSVGRRFRKSHLCTVATDDDEVSEAGGSVVATLTASPAMPPDYSLGTPTSATVSVSDNDAITLSVADATAVEGTGNLEFVVTLSAAFDQPVTLTANTAPGAAGLLVWHNPVDPPVHCRGGL